MNARYVGRVNKLDALQLDSSIRQIIKEQQLKVKDGAFETLLDFQRQIDLLTSSAIWWHSFRKHNATLGQQLLALKYDAKQISRRTLIWHYVMQVLLPSFYKVGESGNEVVKWLENLYIVSKVVIFFRFCYNGARPNTTDLLLGLDLHNTEIKRTVSYSYMNRELIWNGFIEFLVYTIPMINFQVMRNRFRKIFQRDSSQYYREPDFRANTLCIYCHDRPTLPHHIGCGHVYCYFCLAANVKADANFSCVECGGRGKPELVVKS